MGTTSIVITGWAGHNSALSKCRGNTYRCSLFFLLLQPFSLINANANRLYTRFRFSLVPWRWVISIGYRRLQNRSGAPCWLSTALLYTPKGWPTFSSSILHNKQKHRLLYAHSQVSGTTRRCPRQPFSPIRSSDRFHRTEATTNLVAVMSPKRR
jgi:hypothetical protein